MRRTCLLLAIVGASLVSAGCRVGRSARIGPPTIPAPLLREPHGPTESDARAELVAMLAADRIGLALPLRGQVPGEHADGVTLLDTSKYWSAAFGPEGMLAVGSRSEDGLQIYRIYDCGNRVELLQTAALPPELQRARWNDGPDHPEFPRHLVVRSDRSRWFELNKLYLPGFPNDLIYDIELMRWTKCPSLVGDAFIAGDGVYQVIQGSVIGPDNTRYPLAQKHVPRLARAYAIFKNERIQNFRTGEVYLTPGLSYLVEKKVRISPDGRWLACRNRYTSQLSVWELHDDWVEHREIALPPIYRFDIRDWNVHNDWLLAGVLAPERRGGYVLLLIHVPSGRTYQITDGSQNGDVRLFQYCAADGEP